MKKFFTFFVAALVSMTMMAETIFSFTVTNPASGTYEAVGGTAKCTTAMASGGSNEITIGEQTFYKFNSSSAWEFTLADDGKFAEGDVISITAACQAGSNKSGKGVKLNDIAVTGDFPKGESNTISYTVQAGDAIDGQATITVKRNDSDIKFGTISVERENVTPSTDPVTSAEINGANACIVGNSVELVCTAPKATEYQWSLNGTAIEGANTKKYTFTPTAEGNYSFTCLASNDYTATPVISEPFVVAVVDPAKATGEIIKATLTSGTAANVTGIVGGTADVNLSSSKKLDKGKHFGITLASGNFKEGDTVIIVMTTAGSNYPCLFADKDRTNCLFLATEASSDLEYRIILPSAANDLNTLYVSRGDESDGYKWNPVLTSMSVVRPMPETSRVEELTGAKIADYTLTESNLSALKYNKYIKIGEDYVAAPVVVFTKTITITYEDNSTKEVTEDIKVTATADGNLWKAYATIAGEEYTIAANKAASFTVTYMYGKNVLGTEMVAVGAEPTEYEQYQTMTLATFEGWYRDEDLTTPVSLPMAITQDFTFYASFEKTYLTKNVNIEQLVLDYGTKYDIASELTAAGWAYANIDVLDTLNDIEKKDNRNYAFLGLKLKTKGAYVQGILKTDGVLIVKFGNLGCNVTVTAKGANTDMEVTITKEMLAEMNNEYPIWGFTEDVLITLTTTDGSTVVLKQLMLDEIAEVTLPAPGAYLVTCEANENGKVEAAWPNKKYRTPVGETVTITATPNDGYALASITVNGTAIEAVEGVYSFEMPAEEVTVAAVFTSTVALENIKAEGKAVKVVIDGQLYIKKGDKLFNALGTMLK